MYKTDAQKAHDARLKKEVDEQKELRKRYKSFKTKIVRNCKDGKYRAMMMQAEFVEGNPQHKHQLPEGLGYEDTVSAYKEALEEYREWLRLPEWERKKKKD